MTFPSYHNPDLASLSSADLERYVAAIFQSNFYFVKMDLWWSEAFTPGSPRTVDVLQADVLASSFTPFSESNILVECKGGGTFQDFFKFLGISKLIKPNESFMICNNSSVFEELVALGKKQGVQVLQPQNIVGSFSPATIQNEINFWYWSNELRFRLTDRDNLLRAMGLTNFTANQNKAFSEIKKYVAAINGKIWKIIDPIEQLNESFELLNTYSGFIRSVNSIQGLSKADAENAIARNILCESAASVVLRSKIEVLVAAVRCAVASIVSTDPNYLDAITDTNVKNVVRKMVNEIRISCRLPQFLQAWIYIFGGFINANTEISLLANYLKEREDSVQSYFDFLTNIFSILIPGGTQINWGVTQRGEILEFNGVPDSIRGYGLLFRDKTGISVRGFSYRHQWVRRLREIFP